MTGSRRTNPSRRRPVVRRETGLAKPRVIARVRQVLWTGGYRSDDDLVDQVIVILLKEALPARLGMYESVLRMRWDTEAAWLYDELLYDLNVTFSHMHALQQVPHATALSTYRFPRRYGVLWPYDDVGGLSDNETDLLSSP